MKKFITISLLFVFISLIFISYKFYIKTEFQKKFLPVTSINSPSLNIKLEEKTLNGSYFPNQSTEITFGTINFQIPLDKSTIENILDKGDAYDNIEGKGISYQVTFNTGQKILFFKRETTLLNNKNKGYFIADAKKIYLSKNVLEKLSVFKNEYELSKFLFSQSPENIHFYDSNKNLDLKYELLGLKSSALAIGSENSLSFFETETIKGFQFCKPELTDCTTTQIQFYLPDYDGNFFVLFKNFNQEGIDYIIRSIRLINL